MKLCEVKQWDKGSIYLKALRPLSPEESRSPEFKRFAYLANRYSLAAQYSSRDNRLNNALFLVPAEESGEFDQLLKMFRGIPIRKRGRGPRYDSMKLHTRNCDAHAFAYYPDSVRRK